MTTFCCFLRFFLCSYFFPYSCLSSFHSSLLHHHYFPPHPPPTSSSSSSFSFSHSIYPLQTLFIPSSPPRENSNPAKEKYLSLTLLADADTRSRCGGLRRIRNKSSGLENFIFYFSVQRFFPPIFFPHSEETNFLLPLSPQFTTCDSRT